MKDSKRYLAYDALFCVFMIICSVVMAGLAFVSRSLVGLMMAVLVGIYFRKKKLVRCITACSVILILLFILQGPVLCITMYFWNLLSGILLKYIFEAKPLNYYLIAAPIFFVLFLCETLFYSKLMLNMNIMEYIMNMAEKVQEHMTIIDSEKLVAFIYFGCVAVGMAVLKSITARKIYQVYSKKFEAFDKNLI